MRPAGQYSVIQAESQGKTRVKQADPGQDPHKTRPSQDKTRPQGEADPGQDPHKTRPSQDKTLLTRQDQASKRQTLGKTLTRQGPHKTRPGLKDRGRPWARPSQDKTLTRQDPHKTRPSQDKTRPQGEADPGQDPHKTRPSQDKTLTRQDSHKTRPGLKERDKTRPWKVWLGRQDKGGPGQHGPPSKARLGWPGQQGPARMARPARPGQQGVAKKARQP